VEPTSLNFSVTDPLSGAVDGTSITVLPARVKRVRFYPSSVSQVPLGGKEVGVVFELDGPSGGQLFDVQYGGTTDIQGPAQVRLGSFTVKVSPCGVNPPCTVWVQVQGKRAALTVNP
jgi:hypothetical protein